MSNIININLKEKLDEFPSEIRDIAIEMIEIINESKNSNEYIEEMIIQRINKIINKEG